MRARTHKRTRIHVCREFEFDGFTEGTSSLHFYSELLRKPRPRMPSARSRAPTHTHAHAPAAQVYPVKPEMADDELVESIRFPAEDSVGLAPPGQVEAIHRALDM